SGGGSIDMSTYSTPSRKGSSRLDVSSLSGRADPSYLSIIAGPGGLLTQQSTIMNGKSNSSLESEDHGSSVANSDLPEEDAEVNTTDDGKTHSRYG
ncbi:hypothetical protein SK128_007367, partial [Halocaridina rubra]